MIRHLAFTLVLAASTAGAATFTVDALDDAPDASPGDGACASAADECTLRAALDETNALPGLDQVWLPAGVIHDANLVVLDDLSVTGAGREDTVIDASGTGTGPALDVAVDHAALTLASLTVRGSASQGIRALYDSLVLRDCRIQDNGADGIEFVGEYYGPVEIDRCVIERNGKNGLSGWDGNGVRVVASTIRGNRYDGLDLGEGSDFEIIDSLVADNGGIGLDVYDHDTTILRTAVLRNAAGVFGDWWSRIRIRQSTVADNTSSGSYFAAGVTAVGNLLEITGSTISGNRGGQAGGVWIEHYVYVVDISDSTIAGNRGSLTGGIGIYDVDTVSLQRSIVAGNEAESGPPDCYAPFDDFGFTGAFNLIGDGESCGYPAGVGDLVGTSASPLDPLLAPLGDYGGPTPTRDVLPGSPVIDAVEGDCAAVDQRGLVRPQDGDGDGVARCDIGAVEFEPRLGCGLGAELAAVLAVLLPLARRRGRRRVRL